MQWFNKRSKTKDFVGNSDVEQLRSNRAWQFLTQQWEEEMQQLAELMLSAPVVELRTNKGELISPSLDNVRGQLDSMIAVLTSAKVLDEAIEADISINKELRKFNTKPGGQENA